MREGVKDEIEKIIEYGIIIKNCGPPWSASVVPIPKPDDWVWVCIDYRCLNEVTVSDPYYIIAIGRASPQFLCVTHTHLKSCNSENT